MKKYWLNLFILIFLISPLFGHGLVSNDQVFDMPSGNEKITVDGFPGEPGWAEALVFNLENEVFPGNNVTAPVRGECRILVTSRVLYVAFVMEDPDPQKIRAHVMDRDMAFNDDRVAIFLDTFNDSNRAFVFQTNPLGVQLDGIYLEQGSSGELDFSWDGIWYSAGRITATGYTVEMAIPFKTLQFQRIKGDQTWGIMPRRFYPRDSEYIITFMHQDLDNTCLLCQMPRLKGFSRVRRGSRVELDPTMTGIRSDRRRAYPDPAMEKDQRKMDAGLSGHWGMTPNLTLSFALNPDFSQVEADDSQLAINTQFALYFEEKRPFFLEGKDFFATPVNAVYSRIVTAPDWGVKLTGKEGIHSIGAFAARDSVTQLLLPGRDHSAVTRLSMNSLAAAVRYRIDLGNASTLGALVSLREQEKYFNRVVGLDALIRLTPADSVTAQIMGSQTAYPIDVAADFNQPEGDFSGYAMNIAYNRNRHTYQWEAEYTAFSPEFRADLGFVSRVNIRKYKVSAQRIWWLARDSVLTSATVKGSFNQMNDFSGNLLNREGELDLNLAGPMQSSFHVNLTQRRVGFAQKNYDQLRKFFMLSFQPAGLLELRFRYHVGDEIDYVNFRSGKKNDWYMSGTCFFGRHLELSLNYTLRQLNVDRVRLFTADLYQGRLVYYLNRKVFVRAKLQYSDIRRNADLYVLPVNTHTRELSTQLLFSYKINPRTMLFLGYSDASQDVNPDPWLQMNRAFFFKVGYALSL